MVYPVTHGRSDPAALAQDLEDLSQDLATLSLEGAFLESARRTLRRGSEVLELLGQWVDPASLWALAQKHGAAPRLDEERVTLALITQPLLTLADQVERLAPFAPAGRDRRVRDAATMLRAFGRVLVRRYL